MTIEEQEKYVVTRLKEERIAHKMTQMELALESGVSQNMIAYIETHKRSPTITTILMLCSAMRISPAVLFPKDADEGHSSAKNLLREINEVLMHYAIERKDD